MKYSNTYKYHNLFNLNIVSINKDLSFPDQITFDGLLNLSENKLWEWIDKLLSKDIRGELISDKINWGKFREFNYANGVKIEIIGNDARIKWMNKPNTIWNPDLSLISYSEEESFTN